MIPAKMESQKGGSNLNSHLLVSMWTYAAFHYHTKMKTLVRCSPMWKLYVTHHHVIPPPEVRLEDWPVSIPSMRHVYQLINVLSAGFL